MNRRKFVRMVLALAAMTPNTSRASDTLIIAKIGQTKISGTANADPASIRYIYVDRREPISCLVPTPGPGPVRLHPMVRVEGTQTWLVQAPAQHVGAGYTADVEFGGQAEGGVRFELMIALFRVDPPRGPIPAGLLSRSALETSEIVKVERRTVGASVGIASINGQEIYGDVEPTVQKQGPIEVVGRNLGDAALIGVAIQPVEPWTDHHWLMVDRAGPSGGVIYGHFGEYGMHNGNKFSVLAFAARLEDWPPTAVPISPDEWQHYVRRFTVMSRAVRVERIESEFLITDVAGRPVIAGSPIGADDHADVKGTVDIRLVPDHRIWLACVARKSKQAWIAGWTDYRETSGRWRVNAARIWSQGLPQRFQLVAFVSETDPRQVAPDQLWSWVQDQHYQAKFSVDLFLTGRPANQAMRGAK